MRPNLIAPAWIGRIYRQSVVPVKPCARLAFPPVAVLTTTFPPPALTRNCFHHSLQRYCRSNGGPQKRYINTDRKGSKERTSAPAMTTEVQKNLVERNEAFAAKFTKGDLPLAPGKKYLIVTCMDARIDATAAFGIDLGDAHIIRNAGGSGREALRSILISEQFLGTREIVLIKHTGCGMVTFTNETAHALVRERLGPLAAAEIATLDFLPFPDLDLAVRDDVDYLRKQSAIPDDVAISGWVYDVETGRVRRVV